MLTTQQRLQYKDALEHVSKFKPYYKVAKQILVLIDEFGIYYEYIDDKTVKSVREKFEKSNWIFIVLERYVTIGNKYKTKFDYKFFDHCYIKSFDIPDNICKKINEEYDAIMLIDRLMKARSQEDYLDNDINLIR